MMAAERNFVERYTAWASSFTDAPEQFHRFVAYFVASVLLGRQVHMRQGDDNLFPVLWLVILAPSSFYRKSTSLSLGRKIINEVRPNILLPTEWTQESLIALMQDQPQGVMTAWEFKSLLSLLSKDYNAGAMSFLTEIFDCPDEYRRRKGVEKPIEFKIDQPHVSILGASTVDWLINSVREGDVAGGFLARFLFVSADRKAKSMAFQPEADQAEKRRLVEMARALTEVRGRMDYALDARQYYEGWFRRFEQKADTFPDIVKPYFPRLAVYAHKFAMLESVLNGHFPTITLGDCENACLMAQGFGAEIRKLAEENLGQDKFQLGASKVLKMIQRRPGMDRSTLLRNAHKSAKVFKDIIDTLTESGQVHVGEDGGFYPSEAA